MYKQSIYGMPKTCLNRKCKHVFFKDSHLGWLPKSETEVYSVMRCPACKDTFMVAQMINMVYKYHTALPENPAKVKLKNMGPITLTEINNAKSIMEGDNFLSSLNEGRKPGASSPPISED